MSVRYRRATPEFATQTQAAKKILVIEIAGLGDLVHSLPALWSLRQHYPRAELHCLVREPCASLLRLTPWIDRVWAYRRGKSGRLGEKLVLAREVRAQHFDVVVDLMGADHSVVAGWISGARRRLVRKGGLSKPRRAWPWLSTDVMDPQFAPDVPMYRQRLQCLQQAGLRAEVARFELVRDRLPIDIPGLDPDDGGYLHISPYTRRDDKQLPPVQMAELLTRLHTRFPQLRMVVSCAPTQREREALAALLAALPFTPWSVFAGELDIPQLYRLIEGATVHIGGDTGSIHLAWLAGTPSVSWFRISRRHLAWIPRGAQHAVVYSDAPGTDYLQGIDTEAIIEATTRLMRERGAVSYREEVLA